MLRCGFCSDASLAALRPASRHMPSARVCSLDSQVGVLEFQVLQTPCHTVGHVCYYLQTADAKCVFTGDTLFVGISLPLPPPPPSPFLCGAPRYEVFTWTHIVIGEGRCPSSVWTRHIAVTQEQSGVSVGTTDPGKTGRMCRAATTGGSKGSGR